MKTLRSKLIAVAMAAFVVGGGVTVVVGALADDESSDEEAVTASESPAEPRPADRLRTDVRPTGCTNRKLTPSTRGELERALGQPIVKGSIYYGACNGRYWSMARFRAGGDGVFGDVRSATVVELGSIAKAKCKVPYGLLKIWRQADDCIAASSDPSADPDDPQSTVKIPDPNPPGSDSRAERCKVPEVKVPNYDPTDNIPDQRLPRPEELLPPKDKCPEAYEGIRGDNPQRGQRRYPNGRTYIEQVNFCNLMRSQGVPCTVPPPP